MNLLKDVWLPVIREDGRHEIIAITQITENHDENPIVELDSPRSDFRNGLYQLLIGIVQVAALPEDEDEWVDLFYKPYNEETFKEKLLYYEDCFEIDSEGPAFMQDYDLLEEQTVENLRNLFVSQASEPNVYFNKAIPKQIDPYWAAAALYCLNTFGPAGGRGHRTGIRGGGPVTTILIPGDTKKRSTSLWEKIWFNVFSGEQLKDFTGDSSKIQKSDIFPWMKPTVISGSKGKCVYPQDCNPLVMYFAMPRRIRFVFEYREGICDLTGKSTKALVTGYRTYHSGNDYQGHWIHPLNAYRYQTDRNAPPISIKGSPGGFSYRDWMLLSLDYKGKDAITPFNVAYVQKFFNARKAIIGERNSIAWNAGYDLSNIKARAWYEAKMPVFPLDSNQSLFVKSFAENAIEAAGKCISHLQSAVKTAWYKNPKEIKGDFSFISNDFYSRTEKDFYNLLDTLVKNTEEDEIRSQCAKEWEKVLNKKTFEIFNFRALAEQEDGLDMKRVIAGRGILFSGITKAHKILSVMQREEQ
ncbi:MAG: type I-E CRISPR-associated protein Cse1/CasA [Candidatus Cloacimonetes bacterium]|nr:type I-E CRISPR-associated protein Cse1/CasA [Candidatus Cloacimonadota bacterium]